ncbi:LpxI family protein [Salipiger mucosus]|uniref:UDP-2,3-diacylglucosamine pyrophosphatase n=1 Tax=Salipiger mucosus DSM 16094 TaxID=1123237 RepID=S9QE25_9RHOB|nr:UDP-2,3-diacylglucosamine diphosphatase LpxI [Salipiger mucosus]EPX78157.1 UDP-2,3-diacylglucosamine pyrophosphatase [Salipiger mucosus DSM 16094]
MLALIAGQGALPRAVAEAQAQPPVVCALEPLEPEGLTPDIRFRIERLGRLLRDLEVRGVTTVCMCGAVPRPELRLGRLDWRTLRLLPRVIRALRRGDDGALRIAVSIFEDAGLRVIGAHEAAPVLLPPPGVATRTTPGEGVAEMAALGDQVSAEQGAVDLGQACVIRGSEVLAREDDSGTDAMLAALPEGGGAGGILYKAPKPGQDRRVDLPVIGPQTARGAVRAGLAGIVIEARGVMVLNRAEVIEALDAAGAFLWVRERPEP